MSVPDASATLRRVAALRTLCLRLPHVATPAEAARLHRFEALVATPERAADTDIDAIVAGWRNWWRSGAIESIYAMGERLPWHTLPVDRSLMSIWSAARTARWADIQNRIWSCERCRTDLRISSRAKARVALDVRQQTVEPPAPVTRLLVVSPAPPFTRVATRTRAHRATNDPADAMRRFLERTLGLSWVELARRGLALLHSVKCAITPVDRHQNPPPRVVGLCAPQHLAMEIRALHPAVMVTLGHIAHRAVTHALAAGGDRHDAVLRRALPDASGATVQAPWGPTILFRGVFPQRRSLTEAAAVVRHAATVAGLLMEG